MMPSRALQEIRVAARRLLRTPAFSVLCIFTLALGIGMVVAIFALVYGILLQELPYPESHSLFEVSHDAPGLDLEDILISAPLYERYREVTTSFDELAMLVDGRITLTGREAPDRVRHATVTPSLFSMLQVPPLMGRTLLDADAQQGAAPVVVISSRLWESRLGSDPAVLGSVLELDGTSRTIVGVMPPKFGFPDDRMELWLPFQLPDGPGRLGAFGMRCFGRLSEGSSEETALVDLRRVIDDLAGFFPDETATAVLQRAELRPTLANLRDRVVGQSRAGLWLALGSVSLVLLMACANVANLFLVRSEGRQREVAIHKALGAAPSQVARGFFVEALLLSSLSGGLAVGVAQAAIVALKALAPPSLPRLEVVGLSSPVLAFAALVSVSAAVLFSLLPALQSAAATSIAALKDGSRGAGWAVHRVRARQMLVVIQVALAVVLLIGAGLLIRTFRELGAVDLGFDAEGVYSARVSLPSDQYPSEDELTAFAQQLIARLEAIPEVSSAAVVSQLPLSGRGSGAGHAIEDQPLADDELPPVFSIKNVGEGYFDTLGIPLLEGRDLTWSDAEDRQRRVAVVSKALADTRWPAGSAVGKRIRQGRPPTEEGDGWTEIVGVVGNALELNLRGEAPEIVYYPLRHGEGEGGLSGGFAVLARTPRGSQGSQGAKRLAGPLREVVWDLDRNLPITREMTLRDLVDEARSPTTFSMLLLIVAAVIALALGTLGVYGVISFLVTMRTQEIGIRLAIGAERGKVRNEIVRGGAALCSLGVLTGLAAAFLAVRLLRSTLYNVSPYDLTTFVSVPVVLLAAACVASFVPARRASRIDPADALRWE